MNKNDRLGTPESFVSKAASLKGPMAGASSGIIDPGRLAEAEIGEINWGEFMGYMARRFGPPNLGSDSHKEIARWMITTPMKGLFLTITIAPHQTSLLFGYLIDRDLDRSIDNTRHEAQLRERDAFSAWCIEKHGAEPRFWRAMRGELILSPQDKDDARTEIDALLNEFGEIYEKTSADPRIAEVEQAARRALRDLHRTVGVRDQWINANGVAETPFRSIEHSRVGLAVPAYVHTEEMRKVHAAVHRLGGGAKGLKRLVKMIEDATPATG